MPQPPRPESPQVGQAAVSRAQMSLRLPVQGLAALVLRGREPVWLNREGVVFGDRLYVTPELWPVEDRLLSSEARAYVRSRVHQDVDVAEVRVEAMPK